MVAVAQLVEPWIVIPVVVGSSPISHPIIKIIFPNLF
jgi:O-antigen/teichoic acid export membrane protein